MSQLNGIRELPIQDSVKTKYQDLPSAVAICRNILSLPIAVLHPNSAYAEGPLISTWKDSDTGKIVTFKYKRNVNEPYPTAVHSKYLDILLMMFASKFNKEGILYFKFSTVQEHLGLKKQNNSGTRKNIIDAIDRYRRCQGEWDTSEVSRLISWTGPIIMFCDLWNDDGLLSICNPRNNKSSKKWHKIIFHPKIVEAFENNDVKLFFTEIYKKKIPPEVMIIYKYFYGFVDNQEIKRRLDKVKSSIAYLSPMHKFKPWIKAKCSILVKEGLFKNFRIDDEHIYVTCVNLKNLSNVNKKSTESIVFDLMNLYYKYKSEGKIDKKISDSLELLISINNKDLYYPLLKKIIPPLAEIDGLEISDV